MAAIPHCDELFKKYFARWYNDDDLTVRIFSATRPDMLQISDHIGKSATELVCVSEGDQNRFIDHLTRTMTDAAIDDFGSLLGISKPFDIDWIRSIDDYYDLDRIADLICESNPSEDGNDYFITCIELGCLIAKSMRTLVPDLEWIADSPYWESSLWHSQSGYIIPPTHWAIKKLSYYGWDDGLIGKIQCSMQALQDETKPI